MPTQGQRRVRGRLAPSPTGVLHLGNARSFVLAWLDARSQGGEILMRIEDLDGPRVQEGAEAAALEDLAWLGLDWDAPFLRQSERTEIYRQALDTLHQSGLAYPCICSRKDVQAAASAPHGLDGVVYPGSCRGRFEDAAEAREHSGRLPSWRFAAPKSQTTTWHDEVLGLLQCQVAEELGDFVIWRNEDQAAYQLAVVVDDIATGVSRALRGDDLTWSTARQLLLYEALGAEPPAWVHIPLVVSEEGRRLAKRDQDLGISTLRAQGVSAGAILTWIAKTSGIEIQGPVRQAADLIPGYSVSRIPKTAVTWTGGWPKAPAQ